MTMLVHSDNDNTMSVVYGVKYKVSVRNSVWEGVGSQQCSERTGLVGKGQRGVVSQ